MLRASSLGLHVQHGLRRKILSKSSHSWTRRRRNSFVAFNSYDSASPPPSIPANVVDHRIVHGILPTQHTPTKKQNALTQSSSTHLQNIVGEEGRRVEGEYRQVDTKGKKPAMMNGFPSQDANSRQSLTSMTQARQELVSVETPVVVSRNEEELAIRKECLQEQGLIQRTKSIEVAWDAYKRLLALEEEYIEAGNSRHIVFVRQQTLYKLSRLLASSKPHTRQTFLRLLAVLSRVRKQGGSIKLWQWNAVIDCAGKGWRKTTVDDYKNALSVFNEMTGSREKLSARDKSLLAPLAGQSLEPVEPDIITYTTLLNIASKTKDRSAMRHAHTLLQTSNLPKDEIAHLSTLTFEVHHHGITGARQVFDNIRSEGLDHSLNGINAFLWSCMREGRISTAEQIYEALLRNEEGVSGVDSAEEGTAAPVDRTIEGLCISASLVPDFITHTIMAQGFAYHGYLLESLDALDILFRALEAEEGKEAAKEEQNGDFGDIMDVYKRTLPAFRGLFLGFKRHGQSSRKSTFPSHTMSRKSFPWDEASLNTVLDTFFNLPEGLPLKENMVYWAMMALQRVTDRDEEKMKSLWLRLQDHFVIKESSRLNKFRSLLS